MCPRDACEDSFRVERFILADGFLFVCFLIPMGLGRKSWP